MKTAAGIFVSGTNRPDRTGKRGSSWQESRSFVRRIFAPGRNILKATSGEAGGQQLEKYYIFAAFLHGCVIFMLMLAVNQLKSRKNRPLPMALGALLAGAYAWACAATELSFLQEGSCQAAAWLLVCLLGFARGPDPVGSSLLFSLLRMALETLGQARPGSWVAPLILGAAYWLTCRRGKSGLIPVELEHGGKRLRIMALPDTGNSLRDPLSGQPVLVLDAAGAKSLLGLTSLQLADPVSALADLPGYRLIPYKSVNCANGFLLARTLNGRLAGGKKEKLVVAFSPQILDDTGKFQALTGGFLW